MTAQVSAHTTLITIATLQKIADRGDGLVLLVCLPDIRRAYPTIAAARPKREET